VAGCGAGTRSESRQSCARITGQDAASTAQLARCGLHKVPLSSTTALPHGGISYNYKLADGQIYSVREAPVGFNALTASAAEDAAYGIPPRPPKSSPGYATWKKLASSPVARVTPRPFLIVGNNPERPAAWTSTPTHTSRATTK
jgi:hypothetical protein